jgi:hypothetical protein
VYVYLSAGYYVASATLFIKAGEHHNTVTPAIAGQKADGGARALKKKSAIQGVE